MILVILEKSECLGVGGILYIPGGNETALKAPLSRAGESALKHVGLKAPITVRDLHSEVRRDWKQLIGRKLAHSTAVKTGLGECPKKRGSPEN
jgi:hypothetical protein